MYDLSEELINFYNEHVKLPQDRIDELFEKKDINISRLEKGLEKYNEKNNTSYVVKESYVQGSVGMGTVTQNEEKDYDIDVGILVDGNGIDSIGSDKIKNVILSAFNQQNLNFKTPPEKHTNCIRFTYYDGYQIDFAVYRDIDVVEHAGSVWRERSPEAIQSWFDTQKLDKGNSLPVIIKLIKIFNKSRGHWKMPGGLITTILVEESLATEHHTLDKILYYTIENIINRLDNDGNITSPVYPYQSILYNEKDKQKVESLKKRLKSHKEKLEILNNPNCTRLDAIEAWQTLFNHTFWDKLYSEEEQKVNDSSKVENYREQYIDELFPVLLKYPLEIDASIELSGFRPSTLSNILKKIHFIPKNEEIKFFIQSIAVPKPYDIYWKVRNVGPKAYQRNQIRGQIFKTNNNTQTETSVFRGKHFVECYIVKDGVCIARDRIHVPI